MKVSTENAEHYQWGNGGDGWHLLKSDSLSVIQETMPPGTSEQTHYHERVQQLFYILCGNATFEIAGKITMVLPNETIHIPAGVVHKICNNDHDNLTFVLVSQPRVHGDRINVSDQATEEKPTQLNFNQELLTGLEE